MKSFYKYLIELKNRVIVITIAWLSTVISSYMNKEILLFEFIKPCTNNTTKENFFYFISTDLTEIFFIYLKISFFIANQFTAVFAICHLLIFSLPGMYLKEQNRVLSIFVFFIFSWLGSIVVFSQYALPKCWNFFTNFHKNNKDSIKLFYETKILNYIVLFIDLYYAIFVCILFFFFIFFLFNFYYNKKRIKKSRKIFYAFFIIIATFITPPDLISQLFVLLNFLIMFELIVIVVILININK